MRVQDIMTRKVETIASTEPVEAAVERMRQKRIRHLVVMRRADLVGIVSEGDLREFGAGERLRVEDVMTAPAIAATADMTIRKVANLLRRRSLGCLPVVEHGRIVGIVTTTDLLERIGRGAERPADEGKRWTLKGRGPRRKSVVGHRGFAAH